jgi:hypothetical protein
MSRWMIRFSVWAAGAVVYFSLLPSLFAATKLTSARARLPRPRRRCGPRRSEGFSRNMVSSRN